MQNDRLKNKSMTIFYEKGHSDIISGVKQKDARKLESKGAIGGCGTYRTNTGAKLGLIVTINKKVFTLDIKAFIQNELGFVRFTENRVKSIDASVPHILDFINHNDEVILDENSESVKSWPVYMKKIFS